MSAEDRLQENYEEADASVEMDDELSAFSYSDVSVIPYTIENLAKGFTNLSESEVERLKTCDQYNQKSLVAPEEGIGLQINYGDVGFYFYAVSYEDAQKYLNVTRPIMIECFHLRNWQIAFRRKTWIRCLEKKQLKSAIRQFRMRTFLLFLKMPLRWIAKH